MNPVFADTFYYLALMNKKDAAHEMAVAFSRSIGLRIVTTGWILTELADALSPRSQRESFAPTLRMLRANPCYRIVPLSQSLFDRGVALYSSRKDKDWSLTDCIPFVVMREHGLTDALTSDRHFEQAGFKALLI